MLSQKQRKLITSLQQKKYRNLHNLFVVEGMKVVNEFLESNFELHEMFSTSKEIFPEYEATQISEVELKKISSLKSPNKVLALFKIPSSPGIAAGCCRCLHWIEH